MLTTPITSPQDETTAPAQQPAMPEVDAPGGLVHQSKEQEIINQLSFDAFDYVGRNGYIGKNKIWNYDLENKALRFRAPLGMPRAWEPNHGLNPLLPQLAPQQNMEHIKKWLNKNKSRKRMWKAAHLNGAAQGKSCIPDDINMNAPSHCLKTWEKPSFLDYSIQTQFKPKPAYDGDGSHMNKLGFKSVYDAWRSPMQRARPIQVPGLPPTKKMWMTAQHDHVHY